MIQHVIMVSSLLVKRGAWFSVGAFIAIVQLVDIVAFDNKLRHLTNWAFLLHMVLCFHRGSSKSNSLTLPQLVLGWAVAVFVAVGIGTIMDQDDVMLKHYSETLSPALVHVANTVMHFIPPVAWLCVIAYGYRPELKAYVRDKTAVTIAVQLNLPSILFILAYGALFNPRMEYEGPHVNYHVLFSAGITSILASVALVLLLSVT